MPPKTKTSRANDAGIFTKDIRKTIMKGSQLSLLRKSKHITFRI